MRSGADKRLSNAVEDLRRLKRDAYSVSPHNVLTVYAEMFRQICTDYATLPDPRSLEMSEIRFFYDGVRATLQKVTAPTPVPVPSKARK